MDPLPITPSSCRPTSAPGLRIEYDLEHEEWITLSHATTTLYFFPKTRVPGAQGNIRLSKVSFKWLVTNNATVNLLVKTGHCTVEVSHSELTGQRDPFEYTVPPNDHRSPPNTEPSVSVKVNLGEKASFRFESLKLHYEAVT
jgi:hypothetical protein